MLTCDALTYKNRFQNLGFSLVPGALLAIYGEDATGIIMLMAGKLKPTSGQILFEDRTIYRHPEYKSLSLYIGTDIKNRFWETTEQAVKRLAGTRGGGAKELAEAAIRYFGLQEVRHTKCKTLPSHMLKRIMLTPMLTHPRPIWLLDYPEQHLDTEGLTLLDTIIANRCNQDGIVVMSTQRTGFMNHLPSINTDDWKAS